MSIGNRVLGTTQYAEEADFRSDLRKFLIGIRRELELISRLMLVNQFAGTWPGVLFVCTACQYCKLSGVETIEKIAIGVVVFFFYDFIFDAGNQTERRATEEDAINKPHRPIPAGLVTRQRLRQRFWIGMAIYTTLGALLGVLPWILLWQATVLWLYYSRPRDYIWVKPIAMFSATFCQLVTAWQLVTPIDSTGWLWIAVLTTLWTPPLRFEDLRDMEGDRNIGRVTSCLRFGEWPLRIKFAVYMYSMPFALYFLLYRTTTHASTWVVLSCSAAMLVITWSAGTLGLLVRNRRMDAIAYQVYMSGYILSTITGAILL
ncbi:UbiA family prenyltransferase [Nocardia vulneris]|uniref:UbiA family prenyltransferase n=1 Tax=Nocardia vulneris TaxID=1141657 RepID=UPI0030CD62AC